MMFILLYLLSLHYLKIAINYDSIFNIFNIPKFKHMGGCLVQKHKEIKYKSQNCIRIKEEFNIAIPPTSKSLPFEK